MNRAELKVKIEVLDMIERELKQLRSIKIGCESCENYARGICEKWQAAPPPDIASQGCDEWTYDFIPF